ncbi:MAG TPA: MATE family efflux transporter [Bacillota bacterium]|nr:MATE family efflux transporter [Bacillota bacterium]HPL53717.1 MATE family efflux transporter [Bacillota bacterium]
MTQGEQKKLLKEILTLSVPTMLGLMFETLYEIVDMAWVAKLSINSVAAVTIFATIWWILDIVNSIIGISSVTLISRFYGAGDKEKTVEAIEQTIIFKFLLALIVGILMSFIIPYILYPISGNREVLELATIYGRIRLITLPLAFSSYTVNTALRCVGDAKKPLYIMTLSGVLNMILDPIMIFDIMPYVGIRGMGLGIAGAAYATVISQAIAFFVGLYILMSGRTFVRIGFKRGIYFVKSLDIKLIKIGLPTGLESLLRNMGSFVVMKFISSFGVVVVAAFGICIRIIGLIAMPIFGLQMGTGVIVGQNLGSSESERAEKAGYLTAKLSFIFMLAAGIILALTPGPIMGIFTADEEIIRIGAAFLRYFTIAAVFMGPAGSLSSILNGAGDNMPAMMGALISIWFVQIPLLYVSIQLLQLSVEWVWISYIVAYAVHYYVILRYVKGGKWKDKCVI